MPSLVPIDNINDVSDFYRELEATASRVLHIAPLLAVCRQTAERFANREPAEDARIARLESDIFAFQIADGEVVPQWHYTDEDGRARAYPSLATFNADSLAYLGARMIDSKHPLLISRYAHLLWTLCRTDISRAHRAVDAYFALVNIVLEDVRLNSDASRAHSLGLRFIEIFEPAYILSNRIGYRDSEVRAKLVNLLATFPQSDRGSLRLRHALFDRMLSDRKRYSRQEFGVAEEASAVLSDALIASGDYHSAISILKQGAHLAKRSGHGVQHRDRRRQVAQCYEKLMSGAEQANNMAFITFCEHAIAEYKRLKDVAKLELLERKYVDLKGQVRLHESSHQVDLTPHMKKCGEAALDAVSRGTAYVLHMLAFGPLVPKVSAVEASLANMAAISSLSSCLRRLR